MSSVKNINLQGPKPAVLLPGGKPVPAGAAAADKKDAKEAEKKDDEKNAEKKEEKKDSGKAENKEGEKEKKEGSNKKDGEKDEKKGDEKDEKVSDLELVNAAIGLCTLQCESHATENEFCCFIAKIITEVDITRNCTTSMNISLKVILKVTSSQHVTFHVFIYTTV